MSSDYEREARSLALEKAYVHQVYQQISGASEPLSDKDRAWPRVKQFLSELEPGSLICDVGCGNGKYLNVNQSVFKIGADRCKRLTEVAREKEHEVLICDNLALPFREESFDAVLSIAVVHHFATTDRRVQALRELARVLKIGGKLMISVWAMEQRHRKFESQDVLVPWHKPQNLSTPSLEMISTTTTTSEEDGQPLYHAYTQTSDSESAISQRTTNGVRKRGRSRHKGKSIDPARPISSSQSSSSLSSPNETCYSFVRRALQKLAGGKRGGSGRHKPWFLESWSSCTKEPPARRYDPEGCENVDLEDIQDLPIELRRLEEDTDLPQRRQTLACTERLSTPSIDIKLSRKSKSLSDILTVNEKTLVRSQSSVPSMSLTTSVPATATVVTVAATTGAGGPVTSSVITTEVKKSQETSTQKTPVVSVTTPSKPKLVKQKQSLCEEEAEDEGGDEPTDMRDLVKKLPDFKISISGGTRRTGSMFKQSSMNEELMSTERLREKERVRQNIQKQASLNEEFLFRRNRTFDSIKDTFFSTSAAKRFQLLKDGLTSKIKSSTTGIEKVAGASFKNGFVRILQGWKSENSSQPPRGGTPSTPGETPPPHTPPYELRRTNTFEDKNGNGQGPGERRHSREDGSDSSKDSSLQSDTSVDSEDSFASVIFIPKHDAHSETSPPQITSPSQSLPQSPQPTSPKPKTSLPTSPKFKFQCPTFPAKYQPQPTSPNLKQLPTSPISLTKQHSLPTSPKFKYQVPPLSPGSQNNLQQKLNILNFHQKAHSASFSQTRKQSLDIETEFKSPSPVKELPVPTLQTILVEEQEEVKPITKMVQSEEVKKEEKEEKKKSETTRQQKTIPPSKAFPLVRRSTTGAGSTKVDTMTKPLPKLLSLELFNPETDDMDSDSSGVSSPDSVSSVISVLTEELSVESHDLHNTKPSPSDNRSNSTNDSDLNLSDHSLSSLPNSKSPEFLSSKSPESSALSKSPELTRKLESSKSPELVVTKPEEKTLKPETNEYLSSSSSESLSKSPEIKEETEELKPKVPERTSSKSPELMKIKSRLQQNRGQKIRTSDEVNVEGRSRDERFVTAACERDVSPSKTLLEAAADVASSLEDAVDAVIQSSPRARRRQLEVMQTSDHMKVVEEDLYPFTARKRSPGDDAEVQRLFKKCETSRMKSGCDERYPDFEFCRMKNEFIAENVPLLSSIDFGSNQSLYCAEPEPDLVKKLDSEEMPGSSWSLGRGEKHRHLSDERKRNTSTWSLNRYETIAKVPLDNIYANSEGNIRKSSRKKYETMDSDWSLGERRNVMHRIPPRVPERPTLGVTKEEESSTKTLSLPRTRSQRSHSLTYSEKDDTWHEDNVKESQLSSDEKGIFTSLPDGLQHMQDPYITKLSEELLHLTKLSVELKERNNYLASLSDEDLNKELKISPSSKLEPTNPFFNENNLLFKDNDSDNGTNNNFDDSFVPFEIDSPPKNRKGPNLEDDKYLLQNETCSKVVQTNVPIEVRTVEGSENDMKKCEPVLKEKRLNLYFLKSASLDDHTVTKNKTKSEGKNGGQAGDVVSGGDVELKDTEICPGIERDISKITITSSMGHSVESSDTEGSSSSKRILSTGNSMETDPNSSVTGLHRDVSRITIASSQGQSIESSDPEASECCKRDTSRVTVSTSSLGHSIESSDQGDVSERTGSGSDFSRKETSSGGTGQTAGSTASLGPESGSDCSKDVRYADRRTTRCDGRSSSDETPRRVQLVRQKASTQDPPENCETCLSGSTSQESLPSDNGGGSITFHRYYHVFREGELDQLIERYVDNLHIISSYYDHSNWCVIAEKVQVWTI